MKRKLTASNLIGPGVAPVERSYVEIAPAFPFDDGSATNWDIPVRINLVNGAIPTADQPLLEDTYAGEPMTWNIRVVFEDARAKFLGGSRQVAFQLPEGTGDVDYTDLIPVDVVAPPEFGPTYLQQTLEARDETIGLVADAQEAAQEATAAVYPASTVITYDGAGNVQTVTENGVTTTYAYNGDGSVHTDSRLGVTRTYTYDGSGNLTGIAS